MQTLWQDLRYGVRMLTKNRAFTAVAVLTLALGIGANTALFSVVKAVLLNSLPYHQPDRLVVLAAGDRETSDPIKVSYGETADWKARSRTLQSIGLYQEWTPTWTGGTSPEIVYGMQITQNFFPTLGVQPAIGRGMLPEEDRPDRGHVVLLSHAYWVSHFAANPKVIGTNILLDQVPFEIAGVLPETFQSLSFNDAGGTPEVWAPLGYDLSMPDACRTCQHLQSVARLKDGVSVGQARAEMNSIAAKLTQEFPSDYAPGFFVKVTPLHESWYGQVQSALWMLLGATALVLLIACANVASLLLARSSGKEREVALRAALGASRLRLVRQLLTEGALVSVLGGLGGIFLALWGTKLLTLWAPTGIPRLSDVQVDGWVLVFTLVVSVATGILTGLAPALQAAHVDQREALQQTSRSLVGVSRSRLRSLLVIAEVACAFVLAAGSALLLKSFVRAMDVNPGFDVQNLYTTNFALIGPKYENPKSVPEALLMAKAIVRFEREALERIRALPGVEAAGITSNLPSGGGLDQAGLQIQDRLIPPREVPSVDRYEVSPDYFRAMGIPLKRGHLFTESDAARTSSVAIIDEKAARQIWPNEDPIGKRIQLGGRHEDRSWAEIVGIVGDVHQYGVDSPTTPAAYLLYSHHPFLRPCVVIRSHVDAQTLTSGIAKQLWSMDKNVPIWNSAMMSEILATSLSRRRFTTTLFSCFGFLALLLAATGIYCVISYQVAQRTGEIGIRMALGAQRRDVLKMILDGGARPTALGVVLGVVGAVSLGYLLRNQLYGIGPNDPLTFLEVLLVVAVVALAAGFIPTRRATRVDPLVALRYE
ncbi:MAG: ABC transporter permease [Acidobacteria bacterium]|nr:MAG: ABC transporter permease [Acidobacteriota bacterium]